MMAAAFYSPDLKCWFCGREYTVGQAPWVRDDVARAFARCPDCGSVNDIKRVSAGPEGGE